jgi:hypothetical protein
MRCAGVVSGIPVQGRDRGRGGRAGGVGRRLRRPDQRFNAGPVRLHARLGTGPVHLDDRPGQSSTPATATTATKPAPGNQSFGPDGGHRASGLRHHCAGQVPAAERLGQPGPGVARRYPARATGPGSAHAAAPARAGAVVIVRGQRFMVAGRPEPSPGGEERSGLKGIQRHFTL